MIRVTEETLRDQEAIWIPHISHGFAFYPHRILELQESGYRRLIDKLAELNGWDHCYVDFYYGRLGKVERERLLRTLDMRQQEFLQSRVWAEDGIYFQLQEEDGEFLDLLCRLNAEETLFSTLYFTKSPCTLWGNYGLKYILFGTLPAKAEQWLEEQGRTGV